MLSKPQHGWTVFSLGESSYWLSYLTNIPCEWLDQAIHGLETLLPFAVHGVCEPGRMICTVSYWNCHILFEDEDRGMMNKADAKWDIAHMSMLDFCKILYDDISKDIDAWSQWSPEFEANSEEAAERANDRAKLALKNRLARLKELISENQDNFGDDIYFL